MKDDAKRFEVVFLGTGTSTGVPMIGCECEVCLSPDPRNRRLRPSLYLWLGDVAVLIDTSPDLREQALAHNLRQLDAVLYTHCHADHIFGLDDLRRFNTLQDNQVLPVYGAVETLSELKRIFSYLFTPVKRGLYRAKLELHDVEEPFPVARLGAVADGDSPLVTPVDVIHDGNRTLGYRVDYAGRSLGYVPDCADMTDDSVAKFRGVDVMVLDALRYTPPHLTHMGITDSLAMLERIAPRQAYLTHMCHAVDHSTVSSQLPTGVALSYDGLRLEIR